MTPRPPRNERRWLRKILLFLVASLLLHILGFVGLWLLGPYLWHPPELMDDEPVSVALLEEGPLVVDPSSSSKPFDETTADPEKPEELVVEPEKPRVVLPNGQIVEVPPPLEEKVPERSEYLAEHNSDVEKETRSEQFKVNPEILAPVYSRESKLALEDVIDLGLTEPSTGAKAGNPSMDLAKTGRLSPVTSPWTVTNKEGLENPVPSSHSSQDLAGAPSNDRLDVPVGDGTYLRTREFLFATYYNRIRRIINFYHQQQLDNLGGNVALMRDEYQTVVDVTLTAQGVLKTIEVVHQSGSRELDNALVTAFKVGGPFPNPPEQLVGPDGSVYLPRFDVIVRVGQARMQYQGVDPRADVQFPGILKSPR